MRLLFVCLGNICRSPTAEGVMASLLEDAGLLGQVEVDSAGTGAWHVGHRADERAIEAAARRGIDLTSKARQVSEEDFEEFDLILAMDADNEADLIDLAPDDESAQKVRLLRSFDKSIEPGEDLDVPDPYYGGDAGFEQVLDLVTSACQGLLQQLSYR